MRFRKDIVVAFILLAGCFSYASGHGRDALGGGEFTPVALRGARMAGSTNTGLLPSYPNPFNPTTTITFTLASAQRIAVRFFDILGNEVTSPITGTYPAGLHEMRFDGSRLPSGYYFVRLETQDGVFTRRILLLR